MPAKSKKTDPDLRRAVEAIVAAAPPLTEEQIVKLRGVFWPAVRRLAERQDTGDGNT